jgi:hypothetical protein
MKLIVELHAAAVLSHVKDREYPLNRKLVPRVLGGILKQSKIFYTSAR